jgi:hypothetical protein
VLFAYNFMFLPESRTLTAHSIQYWGFINHFLKRKSVFFHFLGEFIGRLHGHMARAVSPLGFSQQHSYKAQEQGSEDCRPLDFPFETCFCGQKNKILWGEDHAWVKRNQLRIRKGE